ncbi:MAG: DUF4198 domain-containing protein [Candidatus Schekmanbacteria bacterium]|nr:DUF4198 domain-containing protein [Candidatus Schekmanbacteria bacterium]
MRWHASGHRAAAVLAVAALAGATAPAPAHDFWITASTYAPARGEPVLLRLFVGEHLEGMAVPRIAEWFERFDVQSAGGRLEVAGIEGGDPAGFFYAASPGAHVVGYQGEPEPIALEVMAFREHLRRKGAEGVLAGGQRGAPPPPLPPAGAMVHERFARCAKVLIAAQGSVEGFARRLGLPLELVPQSDPSHGGEVRVALLFRGRPLAGALVEVWLRRGEAPAGAARTGADGEVTLRLETGSPSLITAFHVVPAAVPAADFDSYWASLMLAPVAAGAP